MFLEETPKRTAQVQATVSNTSGVVAMVGISEIAGLMPSLKTSKKPREDAQVWRGARDKIRRCVGGLGDRGGWYRVLIGPPGSREAATSVCSHLNTAGHSGRWVAAY